MPREVFNNFEGEAVRGEAMETANDVEARLTQLGWTGAELGKFSLAIEAMIDKVVKKGNIELNVTKDENGEETAEVTITGEGNGVDPGQISALIDKEELPVALLTEATTEFFADKNKVVLRRKRKQEPETDTI